MRRVDNKKIIHPSFWMILFGFPEIHQPVFLLIEVLKRDCP
jgi:hypothetical protein